MLKSVRNGKLRTLVKGFIILEPGTVRLWLCLGFPHGFAWGGGGGGVVFLKLKKTWNEK
jgi:hypothetical protein